MSNDYSIVPYQDSDDGQDRERTIGKPTGLLAKLPNTKPARDLGVPAQTFDEPPKKLHFLIREGDGRIEAPANISLLLGRSSSSASVDVDLSPYQAADLGISRQHLKIEVRGKSFMVKDLHSINGTTLNRVELIPGNYYELHDGDELKLGRMHIVVRFVW